MARRNATPEERNVVLQVLLQSQRSRSRLLLAPQESRLRKGPLTSPSCLPLPRAPPTKQGMLLVSARSP